MSMIPPIRCIGPETLDAVAKCDPRTLVTDLAERQAAYYRSLADFPIFGTGSTVPRRGAMQRSR
jgi:lysozyme family protein